MKRHASLIPLSREHHETLIIAQLIRKGAPPYRGMPTTIEGKWDLLLRHFHTHLVPHFKKEEEVLFVHVSGFSDSIDRLIAELIHEHRQLEILAQRIEKEEAVEENLDVMGALLAAHIRKEERELFEMLQQQLDESVLAIIRL